MPALRPSASRYTGKRPTTLLTFPPVSPILRNMSKYQTDVGKLAAALKALAHPHRLRLYTRLVACCAPGRRCRVEAREMRACVGELGKDLGIAPSTVSHHLKELYHAGLIQMERRGQHVECWIAPEALRALATFFGELGAGALRRGRARGGAE